MNYVYMIQPENGGPVKIGVAQDPDARLRQLQIGNHEKLALRHALPNESGSLEKTLHSRYRALRLDGEWFIPCHDMDAIARVVRTPRTLIVPADQQLHDLPKHLRLIHARETRFHENVMSVMSA